MFGQHGEMGVLSMLKMETLNAGMVQIGKIVKNFMHWVKVIVKEEASALDSPLWY